MALTETCKSCGGRGVDNIFTTDDGKVYKVINCYECNGKGEVPILDIDNE